jgi:shikimate dehydrogenase
MVTPQECPGPQAAVLGSPIDHSLSPVLHTAAYTALGLDDWCYDAIELTENTFPDWFSGLGPNWRGLSLTMPLKQVAMPLMDELSPLARTVGAVNTVTWDEGRRSYGDNTDVYGIVEALRSAGVSDVTRACVLGAGATACSAIAAVAELGCRSVQLQARSRGRAMQALVVAGRVGITASVSGLDQFRSALDADLLISTLPSGPAGDWAQALRARGPFTPASVLLDVTYRPWPTDASSIWTAAGGTAVGGFEMLLHQAAAQVRLVTGRAAPIDAMRVAGEQALLAAAGPRTAG